jgi:hypothetical protein
MEIDASIPLSFRPAQVNPGEALQTAMTVGQLARLRRQDEILEEDRRRAAAVRGATTFLEDGSIDEVGTIRKLTGLVGPDEISKLRHGWQSDRLALRKADADAQSAELKRLDERTKLVGNAVAALGDNPSLEQIDAVFASLEAQGVKGDRSRLPRDQSQVPAFIQEVRNGVMGVEKALANKRAELETQHKLKQRQSPLGQLLQDQVDFEQSGGFTEVPSSSPLKTVGSLASQQPAYADPGAPGVQIKPFNPPNVQPEPNLTLEPHKTAARNPFDVAIRNVTQKPPEGFMWNENGNELIPVPGYWEKKGKAEGTSFKNASTLRDDFTKASKDFVLTRDAFTRLKEAARNPSAAGDLSLIFGFMRMLDPSSTVREGEFATAQNAAGVPDRVRNYYNRVMSGERLTDAQRADFVGQAESLYSGALRNHTKVEGQYTEIAKRNNIDPRDVVIGYREMSPDEPRTGPDKPKVPIMTATNPKTKERIQSLDGGKTWQPLK